MTGKDISSAVHAAEELEETAKLLVLLRDVPKLMLSADNVDELKAVFGAY